MGAQQSLGGEREAHRQAGGKARPGQRGARAFQFFQAFGKDRLMDDSGADTASLARLTRFFAFAEFTRAPWPIARFTARVVPRFTRFVLRWSGHPMRYSLLLPLQGIK